MQLKSGKLHVLQESAECVQAPWYFDHPLDGWAKTSTVLLDHGQVQLPAALVLRSEHGS